MNRLNKIALVLGDIGVAFISFFIMLAFGFTRFFDDSILEEHKQPFLLVYLMWFVILYLFNFYDHTTMRPTLARLRAAGTVFTLWLFAGVFIFYMLPGFRIAPKTNLFIAAGVFGVLFLLWRRFYFKFFSNNLFEQVAIVGEREGLDELVDALMSDDYLGYRYRGVYQSAENVPRGVATIVWNSADDFMPKDVKRVYLEKIRLMRVGDMYEEVFQRIPVELIDEYWLVERVRIVRHHMYEAFVRLLDIILSAIIIVVTIPFWIIIGVIIYLDDKGPVFYYQKRVGENKKIFWLRKFRSMYTSAESNGPVWADVDDMRVTRVGKWLRALHLDELPQMINVLIGDISFVGPRPERPELVEQLEKEIPHYSLRHIIKPGFTGWAQIKYRYARSVEESKTKFEYDLYYIKNRNIFLNVGIIMKTVQIIFTH